MRHVRGSLPGQPARRRDPDAGTGTGAGALRDRRQSAAVDGGRAAPARGARVARSAGLRSTSTATSPASSRTISCRRPISSSAPTSPTPASACRRGRTCSTRRASSRRTASGARSGGSSRASASELGFKGPLDEGDEPDVFARLARMLERGGVSLDELKQQPGRRHAAAARARDASSPSRSAPSDGKVDCRPALFDDAIARRGAAVRRARRASPRAAPPHHQARPLHAQLVVPQRREAEAPASGRGTISSCIPTTRAASASPTASSCACASAAGEVELPVKDDADLMPGVVAATHGWGHAERDRHARSRASGRA